MYSLVVFHVFSELFNPHYDLKMQSKVPHLLAAIGLSILSAGRSLLHFLSMCICWWWTVHVDRMVQYSAMVLGSFAAENLHTVPCMFPVPRYSWMVFIARLWNPLLVNSPTDDTRAAFAFCLWWIMLISVHTFLYGLVLLLSWALP